MKMLPELDRSHLQFQHVVLRALLDRVVDASQRMLQDPATGKELRDAQRTLHLVLEAHFREEEALSPELHERLHRKHQMALEALRRQIAREPRRSAAATRRLAVHLLEAISTEESTTGMQDAAQ